MQLHIIAPPPPPPPPHPRLLIRYSYFLNLGEKWLGKWMYISCDICFFSLFFVVDESICIDLIQTSFLASFISLSLPPGPPQKKRNGKRKRMVVSKSPHILNHSIDPAPFILHRAPCTIPYTRNGTLAINRASSIQTAPWTPVDPMSTASLQQKSVWAAGQIGTRGGATREE